MAFWRLNFLLLQGERAPGRDGENGTGTEGPYGTHFNPFPHGGILSPTPLQPDAGEGK